MAGKNPYLPEVEVQKPEKPYTLEFKGEGKSVSVEPKSIPYGETGLAGSILDIALNHGVAIDHACGGVCACSTCHVYVISGLENCSPATDAELDMLDLAPNAKPNSRLACQCVPNGKVNVSVEIPSWNRNLVKEGH